MHLHQVTISVGSGDGQPPFWKAVLNGTRSGQKQFEPLRRMQPTEKKQRAVRTALFWSQGGNINAIGDNGYEGPKTSLPSPAAGTPPRAGQASVESIEHDTLLDRRRLHRFVSLNALDRLVDLIFR
jgi:hypothetical protein